MTRKEKLDIIFEEYAQQELATVLVCTQWELLEKIRTDNFTKGDMRRINKIVKQINNETATTRKD